MSPDVLLVLPSIHDVLAAEEQVRDAGLWVDLLPKPGCIGTDCGMVLGCRADDLAAVLERLRGGGLTVLGTWRVTPGGCERLGP
ncbi:MAG: DUF3343 domain-containing protein [Deltaproteobacteria bacterium]|nr:DUF3343 domain-containing protein [Deltaproteobacteria bacterium]